MGKVLELKCPCCMGALKFDSSLGAIKCQFCDTEFQTSDLLEYASALDEKVEDKVEWNEEEMQAWTEEEGMSLYICESCSGQIIADQNTASTTCPYCGNPVVLAGRVSGDLKPNYVIPFKLDREKAMENLKEHYKNKLLLPSSFKTENQIAEIQCLYVPFWVFDADAKGSVEYKGEITKTWTSGDYRYRETKYYSFLRAGKIKFARIPEDGSKRMDDKLMESIEPYDFGEAKQFNPLYLAGYRAERYDVSKEEVLPRATERVRQGTIDYFKTTISNKYSNVSCKNANINLERTKIDYAFYPVWVLNTKWKEQTFSFAMNGQTGKFVGNLPISIGKAIALCLISFLVIAGALIGLSFAISANEEDITGLIIFIIASLVIGGVATFLIYRHFAKKMKSVYYRSANIYYVDNSMNIGTSKDIYLYRKLEKTRISSKK